jgi:cytochrome b561
MPENGRLARVATVVHFVGQYFGYLFVPLRIAGVLRHAAIMRDSPPDRMLPARR